MKQFLSYFCFVLLAGATLGNGAAAQFDQVFNVPPDSAPIIYQSNTQVNFFDGFIVGPYSIGSFNTTNVQFNMHGGAIQRVEILRNSEFNLFDGEITGLFTQVERDAVVNMSGGSLDQTTEFRSRSELNISGGTIGNGLVVEEECQVSMTGGSIGASFMLGRDDNFTNMAPPAVMYLSGGQIGSTMSVENAVLNMSGGLIGNFFQASDNGILAGPEINITGGVFDGVVRIGNGTRFNIFGKSFVLEGKDISDQLKAGPMVIMQRNVNLSGILADATPFSFDLDLNTPITSDSFANLATVTIALFDSNPSPNLIEIESGLVESGSIEDLAESDDVTLQLQPTVPKIPMAAPVSVVFETSVSAPFVNALTLEMESSVNVSNLQQTVEMFNHLTGEFEQVDLVHVTAAEPQANSIDLSAGIASYLQSKTGQLRVRIRWIPVGPVQHYPWRIEMDRLVWSIR